MMNEALIGLGLVALLVLLFWGKKYLRRSRKPVGWVIGPILPDGHNTSKGYPERPETARGVECAFDFVPGSTNHVHYLTRDRGPISGTALLIEYEIEADEGTEFFAQEGAGLAWITPIIQRAGDDFTANGDMTYYRWWANKFTQDVKPGRVTLTVPLDPRHWRHTMGDTGDDFFRALLAAGGRWGVTFGGPTGLGHGVCSTGPARFILYRFEVAE